MIPLLLRSATATDRPGLIALRLINDRWLERTVAIAQQN
jgi:hypothetical protein